jgi:4-aminobutyrate--pyruvate transaminase
MNHAPNSQEARDIAYHMHPYTNAEKHAEIGPLVIERGDGIYVFDNQGNKYIEAMSGLWSAGLGFSEKRLADVAYAQMLKLPFYHSFTHKTNGPAIDLAEKLISIAPVPMSKVFFTNSGSEAIDTALKMIWYRSNALGKPEKKKIIVRRRGYHGVTIASSCLTSLPYNHKSFDLIVPDVLRLTCPHFYKDGLPGETEIEFATRLAQELDDVIQKEGPDTIAAMFAEPAMGAGGVVIPPETYWEKIQAVLNKYDILLVADEVINGFGRTGNMFGCQTYNITPDIMVLSKQITSSYMPLSALMINDRVYKPMAQESNNIGVFGHGFTAGGHPTPAVVALETINIIEERNLVKNCAQMGKRLRDGLSALSDHPLIGEVRGVGLVAAIELVATKDDGTQLKDPGQLGAMVAKELQNNGVIVRNMVDAIGFCPPMIINADQIGDLLRAVRVSLDTTFAIIQK